MCGIAGIVSYNKNIDIKKWLIDVSYTLRHRGNDDDGLVLFNNTNVACTKVEHPILQNSYLKHLDYQNINNINSFDYFVGILHRRLSIIDLSDLGHQPMCDESGNVWITYNGEVYNYLILKKQLQEKEFQFFSNSDTEVVLKTYLYYGDEFVQYLNGMWALCILDRRTNKILLSRDRLGVKPLYYYHSKDTFAFASEQKAFLKSGLISFEIEEEALSKYLIDNVLEYNENGLIRNIKEIQPGESLVLSIQDLQIKKKKYFELNNLLDLYKENDENTIITNTKNLVTKSVFEHLQSDVEVAVALSGGIDSSVITTLAANKIRNLHTFSIIYPQTRQIDESDYVLEVNQKIESIPHLITLNAEQFFNDLEELLYSQDIPIWSTSTYNQFVLMREVKKTGLKVILSGQGSDELFAGYQHHYVAYWLQLLKSFQLDKMLQHISKSNLYLPNSYKIFLKSIIKNYFSNNHSLYSNYLSDSILENYKETHEHYIQSNLSTELIKDLSYRRLKAFLKCEDRCSMWHGVESRLPFSDDVELIQSAFQITEHLKLKNGISKYVLREAFKDVLPEKIYLRKHKLGFDAPLKEWLLTKEKRVLEEIKDGCKDYIKGKKMNELKNLEKLNTQEIQIIFKLYVISRWRKIWK